MMPRGIFEWAAVLGYVILCFLVSYAVNNL